MARWSGSIGLVVAAALAVSLDASPAAGQVYVPPGGWSPSRMPSLQPTAPAVVVGQIVDAATGRGIPKAIVTLASGSSHFVRVADDRGRFYFVGLHGGQYFLGATKPGYLDGINGQRHAGGDGVPFEIAEHQWTTDARISLWHSATLGGFVSDEAGEAVIGVRVEALRRQFVGTVPQLVAFGADVTDDQGAYRISDLPPGSYVVEVSSALVKNDAGGLDEFLLPVPAGFDRRHATAYPATYHPGAPTSTTALVVTVGNGEDRGNVDVRLTPAPAVSVRGTVVGPEGPIDGQLLRLIAADDEEAAPGRERAVTISAANGAFVFPEVPAGEYVVEPVAAQKAPAAIDAATAPTPSLWGRAAVTVADRDVDDVRITMQPGATVSGQVAYEIVHGPPNTGHALSIDVVAASGRSARQGDIDDQGAFAIHGLAPGSYFVFPVEPPPGWYLKSVTSRGRDLLSTPLVIAPSEEVMDLLVTFTDRPTEIIGTVTDARYYPVATATVLAFPAESPGASAIRSPLRMRSTRATTAGVFHLIGLPIGDYYLVAVDDASSEGWQDPQRLDALRALAVRVSIKNSDPKQQDLQMPVKR
ncbi:MAG: collagen binding domain-containing protein [Vicinamibacterales bacterium]